MKKNIKNFYPRSIELKYIKIVRAALIEWLAGLIKDVRQELPRAISDAHRYDSVRLDADWAQRIRLIINKHSGLFESAFFRYFETKAKEIFWETDSWTNRQQARVEAHIGVDLKKSNLWREGTASAFVHANTGLIKKLSSEVSGKVESIVFTGIQQGQTSKEIANNLVDTGEFTKNRAKLIAHDQVAKLNGQMTSIRQQQAGIEEYEISTSEDERVCEECGPLDGQIFRWDDPDAPKPPIHCACRCSAIANLRSFFEEDKN